MDRLEIIRGIVDQYIASIQDESTKKFAYIHTYGVSQSCAMLAIRRHANVELACIAGMLHDIARYAENHPHVGHAKRSAILSKQILEELAIFTESEIQILTNAIFQHSDKMLRDGGEISEILKDGDVLQHYLYNVNIELSPKDKFRLFYLLEEIHCDTNDTL
ncbi:HD domain-containing protein [Amedibacillus sp. YH-ame6]